MRMLKAASIILAVLLPAALAGGCWNYREIDELAMVAGVAVDKCADGQYEITVEIPEMMGDRESKTKSKVLSGQGRSMLDAVRNIISVSGKKLYWAHTKVIILSKILPPTAS
jgi:spore germination protein KC